MAEIPVITITGAQQKEPKEFFTRVFCLRKEPPPLSLLVDYLKARGATPIITADVNEKLMNSWNWVGIEVGYAKDRDRKSTRLNSSHRTISYAVFCLKKKKE